MADIKKGFEPFYGDDAKILILGSFPSVKSRETEFYYGNSQNRFWKIISEYFGNDIPCSVQEKKEFLLNHNIALWDMVTECEIEGSQDSKIKNFKVADIKNLLQKIDIGLIILNGSKAAEIFLKNFSDVKIPYIKLPSTSPANTHMDKNEWFDALSVIFR